MAILRTGVA